MTAPAPAPAHVPFAASTGLTIAVAASLVLGYVVLFALWWFVFRSAPADERPPGRPPEPPPD